MKTGLEKVLVSSSLKLVLLQKQYGPKCEVNQDL